MDQKELRDLEDKCIQEQPPACNAACPVHVDVRTMTAEASRGDFSAGLKAFKRVVPFPEIIARVCDQPCRPVCKRNEAGDAIAIAAIEKALIDFSPASADKVTPLPARGKRVAVVGGGLSGATAAFDLARKGIAVVIFEATDRLGGSLWDFSEDVLPRPVISAEFAVLEHLGVQIQLNSPVGGPVSLTSLRQAFDAVYLASGADTAGTFDLKFDDLGRVEVDPVSLATGRDGFFAGGSLRFGTGVTSPIGSIGDGRRAAGSIDRFLQGVSLTASREKEGPLTTRLYTNTAGIDPLPAVTASDPQHGYTQEEAMREAARCLQCECLECVKVCEYLAHYGSYPRKYVREIYNNLSIVLGNRPANQMTNSCSLCGLCAEVCPEDLNMGPICRQAREAMVDQRRMPPSAHDFALRDMAFSNSDHFTLARNQPGQPTSKYLFFPGCQLSASNPEHVERAYGYLTERLSGGVGLFLQCCGAPANWSGRKGDFEAAMADLLVQHKAMGSPRMVVACSTCYQMFKAYAPRVDLVSLWELFDRLGLPEGVASAHSGSVSILDPCTSRHEDNLQGSVRRVLQRLGYRIEELPLHGPKAECCGFGGLMRFANPPLADTVVRKRVEATENDCVAYCAMCRDQFAAHGKRTWHLLDLVFAANGGTGGDKKGPDYSQRHENRARLKRRLLKEVWGETVANQQSYEAIKLLISEDLRERMERRLILVEDLQKVIEYAETTGNKILDRTTGRTFAHYKPVSVTYWVEYSRQGDEFVLHNAYSHRMEIAEEVKS